LHEFSVLSVKERLVAAGGGYEVVHESPGLELGVYVLVTAEPRFCGKPVSLSASLPMRPRATRAKLAQTT